MPVTTIFRLVLYPPDISHNRVNVRSVLRRILSLDLLLLNPITENLYRILLLSQVLLHNHRKLLPNELLIYPIQLINLFQSPLILDKRTRLEIIILRVPLVNQLITHTH